MIYRFTIISDEVDDFVREIQIDPEATFYDFHEAILKSVGYANDQMTSFFICDDDWEKGKEVTLEPKYNSKRKIKFGESLYRILKAEKNRQLKNELKYGEFYTVYQLVNFTDEKGAPRQRIVGAQKILSTGVRRINFICVDENGELTTKNSFAYCQRVIRQELGINFDYHSLRHTHATKLIEAGANVKAVQQRLGHKNIVTTMNTYVHHTDEMAQTAADLFESVVNGLPPK